MSIFILIFDKYVHLFSRYDITLYFVLSCVLVISSITSPSGLRMRWRWRPFHCYPKEHVFSHSLYPRRRNQLSFRNDIGCLSLLFKKIISFAVRNISDPYSGHKYRVTSWIFHREESMDCIQTLSLPQVLRQFRLIRQCYNYVIQLHASA